MDKKLFVFLGFLGTSIGIVLIDISVPGVIIGPTIKIILLILALVFDGLAYSSRYYSYLLVPIFKQRKRSIVLSSEDPYWLSPTGDAIVHKEGETFISTVYVKIPLYRSATEMSNDEKLEFTKQISRLVSLSRDPIRFTTQVHMMNKDDYIRKLRDTLSEVENEEASLLARNAKQNEIDRVRGKASMWRHMLDSVSKGISLEMVLYASVSALGGQEFEAISGAQQRARELISGIAAVFGVTPSILTGDAVQRAVEPEFLIPYSTVSEQLSKTLQEQVT